MKSANSLKTPLRYPGGKSRAINKMAQFLPDMSQYKSYREPFLGGGSMALYMTRTYPHLEVWVNDLYAPLATFWQTLRDEGEELANHLADLKTRYPNPDKARELFEEAKEHLAQSTTMKTTPFEKAVSFYILNKCSFSGLTESSSFSKQASDSNFSMRGIEKLPEYSKLIKNWHITNYSYEKLFSESVSTFLYLDPPYDIRDNLYGRKGDMHKRFDHDAFAADCSRSSGAQLISYNSSQLVKDRFKDWKTGEFIHTYTMRSVGEYMKDQEERRELLLFNYEAAHKSLAGVGEGTRGEAGVK